ncbi:hypothetical protein ABT093_29735 [Kitasatospora sp. NPDC002551]|uniref:hypothetical protein n=1 Tax=unclassified Kitasatospora TaxID=2633591 RepID=UPI003316D901
MERHDAAAGGDGLAGQRPAHQPGDPTPVTDPPHGPARGCLHAIGEFLLELAGEAVLGTLLAVLTTGSLIGLFLLAELGYEQSPLLAHALGAVAVLTVVLGLRQLRRPRERRGRWGRILAAVTTGLGVWLLLCVCYASLGDALDAAAF